MAPRQTKNQLSTFPRNVSFAKDGNKVQYHQQLTRACVATGESGTLHDALTIVAEIDANRVIVESTTTTVSDLIESGKAMPAYNYEGGPVSFVPTGRVFIRVGSTSDIRDFESDIADVGFEIEEPHPKFDFAAWVIASSGHKSEALRQCEALGEIDGVENVEPEMLSASVLR